MEQNFVNIAWGDRYKLSDSFVRAALLSTYCNPDTIPSRRRLSSLVFIHNSLRFLLFFSSELSPGRGIFTQNATEYNNTTRFLFNEYRQSKCEKYSRI